METIDKIIEVIKSPERRGRLATFYSESKGPRIILHTPGSPDREVPLKQKIYPFYTVYDLKIAISHALQTDETLLSLRVAPEYQFLAVKQLDYFFPLDFYHTRPGTKSQITISSPVDAVRTKKQAIQFVEDSGSRKILGFESRQRILYETLLNTPPFAKAAEEYHLFLYDDIKAQYTDITERIWNGLLYPYFPLLSYERDEIDAARFRTMLERFKGMTKFVNILESLLALNLHPISLGGVKLLQFQWYNKDNIPMPPVESMFYASPVTEYRPYMRLLPTQGTSVTKIHLKQDKTPDIADPRLLKQWTRERNPLLKEDFVLAKCVIRPILAQQTPLYMTLRMGQNGSADATVIPPKGVRKLDMTTDLENFVQNFNKGIEFLPYGKLPIQLNNASLIYGIHMPPKSESFTKKTLRTRIPIFAPFFQEIIPLPGEQPLTKLRYKCVDNFTSEGRVFSFLTQLVNRKVVLGEDDETNLIQRVEEEFNLDRKEASQYVFKYIKSRGEVQQISADSKEFIEANQAGIDIAIYAQHPFYTFHMENISSKLNLQRILTLLSILFTATDKELGVSLKEAIKVASTIAAAAPAPVEEEEEEENTGAPPPELDAMFAQFAAVDEEEEEESVKEMVRKNYVEPKEEIAALAPVEEVERNENANSVSTEATGLADFFLTKLKEADKRLFDYTKTHPSLKKYVSMCAANITRQPAVLTREQYEEMRDVIYKDDIDSLRINFIVYPKDAKETAKNTKGAAETFYFLKYGTNELKYNQNYYVCSKYFCTRDNLIILESDFKGTRRRGSAEPKPPATCPFCLGVLIQNRRNPGPNETIIQRQLAPKTTDKYATHVGFLGKSPHPEGFSLPCCFIKEQKILTTDKEFNKLRQIGMDLRPGAGLKDAVVEEGEEELEEEEEEEEHPMKAKHEYQAVVKRVVTKYIVGSEKLPLEVDEKEGPQIGLLPPILDQYFSQDISNFINPKTPHKLKPESRGFLRVGVENRVRFKGDSFLAAIAPFYNKSDAREMKDLIWQSLSNNPAIFFQLNYGNFLIEFYDVSADYPSDQTVQRWLEGSDTNRWDQAIQIPGFDKAKNRFHMSFNHFHKWLYSDKTTKEYRHFATLLAQPNFLLRTSDATKKDIPGISFVVLDIKENGAMNVLCPAYGFNPELHGNNDTAFLVHYSSGVWEPIFYVDNRFTQEPVTFIFQRGEEGSWPDLIKQRIGEFTSEGGCYSRGKLSYASRMVANPRRMLPASRLYNYFAKKNIGLEGVLRDPYNHLAALIFQLPGKKIPIPCVDDGYIFPITKIYLDWKDIDTANVDDILEFYQNNMEPFENVYGGFKPKEVWFYKHSDPTKGRVLGILLENLTIVPVNYFKNKPVTITRGAEGARFVSKGFSLVAKEKATADMEWEMDKKIAFDSEEVEGEEEGQTIMTSSEVTEIFEHFRITFANWLASRPDTAEFRKVLKEIIFDERAPLYEKRKSLQVLLETNEILDWVSPEKGGTIPSIQRVDCRAIEGQEQCSGRCVWASEKCLLHAPEHVSIGKNPNVNTARLFMYRLIEELLRFSERRRELLENDMKYIGTIDKVIIQGDQKIIPENTSAWYELLRGDWVSTATEKPKYFEEMSRRATAEAPLAAVSEETKLPVLLETYLGEDPKVPNFRILRGPAKDLFTRIGKAIGDMKLPLTKEQLEAISKETKYPIAQIDLRSESVPAIAAQTVGQRRNFFILLLTEQGAGLLVRDPLSDELPSIDQIPEKIKALFASAPPAPAPAQAPAKIRPVIRRPGVTVTRKARRT